MEKNHISQNSEFELDQLKKRETAEEKLTQPSDLKVDRNTDVLSDIPSDRYSELPSDLVLDSSFEIGQKANLNRLSSDSKKMPADTDDFISEHVSSLKEKSGNVDRTFLNRDEQDEEDDETDDVALEDEEDWVEDEFLGEDDDPALNHDLSKGYPGLEDDLNIDEDEDGDFLSLQDEDDDEDI